MINNQSNKSEEFEPKDSKRKNIKHPQDDSEAVVKPEDRQYNEIDAEFESPAKTKEESEQPVHPIKKEPKDI